MTVRFDIDQIGWGAQKVFDDYTLYDYSKPENYWVPVEYVIHYGGNATKAAPNPAWESWALRVYEQSHLSRGWRALAYNYGVGNSGLVYRIRGENLPAATFGVNGITKAILWIGGKGQEPSDAAKASISRIINTDPMPVYPHSFYRTTNCPGDAWREWINNFEVGVGEMPRILFEGMIDALFAADGEFQPNDGAQFWKDLIDDPTNWQWDAHFWPAFTRMIS